MDDDRQGNAAVPTAQPELSTLVITLLKGVVYREGDERLWGSLLNLQARVRDYVAVLSAWRYGSPRLDISVHDFYYALARLGGHQNRKHDKRPGWLVLWRGWMKLQAMLDGYLAAQRKRCG